MSDRVLPSREPVSVVGKPAHDKLADPTQGQSLVGWLQDTHRNKGNVRVGRLHHGAFLGILTPWTRGLSIATAVLGLWGFRALIKTLIHGVCAQIVVGILLRDVAVRLCSITDIDVDIVLLDWSLRRRLCHCRQSLASAFAIFPVTFDIHFRCHRSQNLLVRLLMRMQEGMMRNRVR